MLEKYRNTMTDQVVHSWALDAQYKLDSLSYTLGILSRCLGETYRMPPEGQYQLDQINRVLHL